MPKQQVDPVAMEERLETALDQVPAGFLRFNDEGLILVVNKMLCSMLGYTAEELKGQPMTQVFTTASRMFCQTHFFPILQLKGAVDEIYLTLRSKTGGPVPVLVNGLRRETEVGPGQSDCIMVRMSMRSQYEDAILLAKKDADQANAAKEKALTKQRLGEEQLRIQTVRLQMATQLAGLAVCDIDFTENTIHLPVEGAAFFELGQGPVTVPRKTLRALVHPGYGEAMDRAIATAMDPDGPGTLAIEYPILLHSGKVRWLNSHMQVKFNEGDGKPEVSSGILVIKDITDRKRLEEDLLAANRHKDEFLATLAHELRNPLAPLLNGLQLLEDELETAPALRDVHDVMKRQAAQLVRLVEDMLDVNRINLGKVDLRLAVLDLKDVLGTALETVEPLIQERKHAISCIMPEGNWAVRADAHRLTQVFINLLSNAAKYTPPQGHITLALSRDGENAVISVKDNGIGMVPEDLPRMFELFAQVKVSGPDTARGGLGIGLNVVKRLVELHGGTVTAKSEGLGKGSQFVVELPLFTSTAPEVDPRN